MKWSAENIPDLTGKNVLVTGASSGIGMEAARQFVKSGARLIMACRSIGKMTAAIDEFKAHTPGANILPLRVDLNDLQSVHEFASEFDSLGIEHLDIIVLNAGVFKKSFSRSKQGYEEMFATNHLGHWLLTGLLLKYIKHVRSARVVVVSSVAHRLVARIDYDAVSGVPDKRCLQQYYYAMSKLANLWFVRELNQRLFENNCHAFAVACHPGSANSHLLREGSPNVLHSISQLFSRPLTQTPGRGALPLIMAAVDRGASAEAYYGPDGMYELRGAITSKARVSRAALNLRRAEELWTVSETLCQFRYEF